METAAKGTGAAEALAELARLAPGVPLLALGQTIFWDEPMKAGIARSLARLGDGRRFVAGVHDTDYFAKLPGHSQARGRFRAFPHNDTTTKGLWSAAGEFSALFGSETVVTRELLQQGGLRFDRVQSARPNFLDDATEAFGWRGVVSLDDSIPVTSELPVRSVFSELKATLVWALDQSLEALAGAAREPAEALADDLRAHLCDLSEEMANASLGELYERLLPFMYRFALGGEVDVDTTRTSVLCRFNKATCDLPRFEIVDLFANQATRARARTAYDSAIHGSGLYGLDRFGTGAIPFDLIVPGHGRGTIRLGTRGIVIATPKPLFISLKKPLGGICDLAEAIEAKFGPECVLVGKAVTLIGMLAREFVFVFHEGASGYVKHTRRLHQILADELGWRPTIHPILRVKYDAWSALNVSCTWMRLPEPFQRAFGTEELCAPSFAARWRTVGEEQEALLTELAKRRRPIDLIALLDERLGGFWRSLAEEYRSLHLQMADLIGEIDRLKAARKALYGELREAKQARVDAEARKGRQFREAILEKGPTAEALAERKRLSDEVEAAIERVKAVRRSLREIASQQRSVATQERVQKVHERRRAIELEAELKRLRLIRHAVICSRGLQRANHRPSAWWFPLVSPDGLWFRETTESAEHYLEPLS